MQQLAYCCIIIVTAVIIIIPTYSRVHQVFWTGVFLGLCSSSPLRAPRNLSEVFSQDVSCSQ